jgi:hypothetical protein
MKTSAKRCAASPGAEPPHSDIPFQLPKGDRIVRRLEDFPDLAKALREGDLAAGRDLCTRLFGVPLRCTSR